MAKRNNRKQKELAKAAEEAHIAKTSVLNADDYKAMAEQCYHNIQACEIGTYDSRHKKYCLRYKETWYTVVYDRDTRSIITSIPYSQLTSEDLIRIDNFKNRIEGTDRQNIIKQ